MLEYENDFYRLLYCNTRPVNRNSRLRSFKFMKNVTLGARGFFSYLIPENGPLEPV